MTTRSLFATLFYQGALDDPALLEELDHSCRTLAADDRAGQGWSKAHGYKGYTSYASLDDLPQRDPVFGDLVKTLNRHVAAFAKDCAFDLARLRGIERAGVEPAGDDRDRDAGPPKLANRRDVSVVDPAVGAEERSVEVHREEPVRHRLSL